MTSCLINIDIANHLSCVDLWNWQVTTFERYVGFWIYYLVSYSQRHAIQFIVDTDIITKIKCC